MHIIENLHQIPYVLNFFWIKSPYVYFTLDKIPLYLFTLHQTLLYFISLSIKHP